MVPVVLFATAFVVRAAVAASFAGPAYPDSYYYVHVAQQLAMGHGFSADYIWNFVDVGGQLPADPTLPIYSNAHWMPLAAMIQVPFIWLLGSNSFAAGLPFWIVGAIAAPLTYWIGRDSGFEPRSALAAGLLTAVPGGMTPFISQPDTFGLFITLGALSLWLCARGLRGDRRAFVAGGAIVGLATLARNDGVLLGLPFAIAFARELLPGQRRVIGWAAAIGCATLFALVLGPWLYRQLTVFHSLAPSAASGRILWITDYSQLFSVSSPASPATFFGQGAAALLTSRIGGLLWALGLFAFLPLVVVLTPFALIGAWVRRGDTAFTPFHIYAISLFAAAGLVFAVHVPYGTFIHSAVALLPHTYLLVVAGVAAAVSWVATRRPSWDPRRARTVFAYGAVLIAAVGAASQTMITIDHWSAVRTVESRLAAALAATPSNDRFMAADPGAYNYLSGHAGIVTPNDPLAVIETAARVYDVRWLVLERGQIVPALAPVLNGTIRPSWLSKPVAVVQGAARTATADPTETAAPEGALYAVCSSPTDVRCEP